MKRPQLNKQERMYLFNAIAKLSREIQSKVNYLAISDKAEQVGCGCIDSIDIQYFYNLAHRIDEQAIALIDHYDLHEEE